MFLSRELVSIVMDRDSVGNPELQTALLPLHACMIKTNMFWCLYQVDFQIPIINCLISTHFQVHD